MRLTLQQRRDARNQLKTLISLSATARRSTMLTYIENTLDVIDYLEPPRWQVELARRRERKARR